MDKEIAPKQTRKLSPKIRVCCLPNEKRKIEKKAAVAGLSTSSYVRNAALGCSIKSIQDHEDVLKMMRLRGDLGKAGGLLKLWLKDDPKVSFFDQRHIEELYNRIEATRADISGLIADVSEKIKRQ